MNRHIHAALQQAHPEDLRVIAQYIRWVKIRRHVHNAFYQKPVHWVTVPRTAHWV